MGVSLRSRQDTRRSESGVPVESRNIRWLGRQVVVKGWEEQGPLSGLGGFGSRCSWPS